MHNNTRQSDSNSKIHYEAKKTNYNQYKHKGTSRKQTSFQDEHVQKESYYRKKYQNIMSNPESSSVNPNRSNERIKKKIILDKKTNKQNTIYYIEFKNKQIELGSTWNEILQSIDRHFPQTDMSLNLAVKINVWKQLTNISTLIIPNQDIEEIFILFKSYRNND